MLAVIGAAVLFGSTGTAQALGPDEATPLGVGAVRILVGAVVLWIFVGHRPDPTGLRHRVTDIVIGAVGVAVYQPGFFIGTERSGVALGTIVALGSAPVFAGTLQWAWLGRRPSGMWALATATMVVGGVMLVLGRGGESVFSTTGTLGSLSAGLGYALFALTTKRLIDRGMGSTEALAWQFSLGALLLVPMLAAQPLAWIASPSGFAMSAHLGVLATGVAYLLYGRGLRSLPTSTAVTLTLVEPVTAAVAAVIILDERLRWYGWLGVVLVVGGLALAGRDPARSPVSRPRRRARHG